MGQSNEYLSRQLLRLPQVLEIIPVGKSTWWEGVRTGRFPASVKLGSRITMWKGQDICKLVDQLSAGKTM